MKTSGFRRSLCRCQRPQGVHTSTYHSALHLKTSFIQKSLPNLHWLSSLQTFSCLLFSQQSVLIGLPYLLINLSHVSPIESKVTDGKTNITNIIVVNAKPKPLLLFSFSTFFTLSSCFKRKVVSSSAMSKNLSIQL